MCIGQIVTPRDIFVVRHSTPRWGALLSAAVATLIGLWGWAQEDGITFGVAVFFGYAILSAIQAYWPTIAAWSILTVAWTFELGYLAVSIAKRVTDSYSYAMLFAIAYAIVILAVGLCWPRQGVRQQEV